ncbi:DUF4405 domain-containing protein [Aureibaculum marinum]|uniref:DUF4405 domain-containing protein n=1 Tax=Aureibaculum marinum TaxID=2487930 RepID=A0A3N4NQB1_9FLAO|nr:DUF4405 domain-containing protein [Aureibaculum marinum]RPD94300.1 DUF4405 domain-containing protein [Aureibaculum marinum]
MKNSKSNTKNTAKTRGILDLFFFILMIFVLIPQSTGIAIHEWLSFIILLPFLLHLILNWNWIVTHSKKLFNRKKRKIKFDYIFNWLLYIVMMVVTVSGIVISESTLLSIGINFTITPFWTMIHNTSATLFIVLLGIHLALHWTWIVNTYKKLQLISDFHHGKHLIKIIKKHKIELLVLITISTIISIGIWLIEFTNWAETINQNSVKNQTSNSEKLPKQWLIYVLPFIKVSVLLCIPAVLTRQIIRIKLKLKNYDFIRKYYKKNNG